MKSLLKENNMNFFFFCVAIFENFKIDFVYNTKSIIQKIFMYENLKTLFIIQKSIIKENGAKKWNGSLNSGKDKKKV